MNNLMTMKNNLIQNFYIIGLSQEDLFSNSENKEGSPNKNIDIFDAKSEIELTPKIITKFPPTDSNHNSIPNEIIIDHCFPNGFKMIKSQKKELSNNFNHFYFVLDNLKYNYLEEYKSIYSKIYFTCLEFNESLDDYQKLKSEITKNNNINNESEKNTNNDGTLFFIPKVICFASLLPFTRELYKILNNLYDYYIYYNTNINNNNANSLINNLSPIEKIVEQIVMCLSFPLSIKYEYGISYKFNYPITSINSGSTSNTTNNSIINLKNNLNASTNNANQIGTNNFPYNNTNINFSIYDPLNCFMNNIYSISLSTLFSYFNEEETIKVFKYILLEIPILFFSEDTELLSQMIQGFISLLQPFTYVLPTTTILPSKFYGIINTEYKFFFGIGENYTPDFFKRNNILLDKTIIVVSFLKGKKIKIEEVKKIEDQKDYVIIDNYNIFNFINNDSVLPNRSKIDLINIDFPIKIKKKLASNLKAFLNESKKKKDNNSPSEYGYTFNQKIRSLFYRFFTTILSGYTDYLIKINNYNNNNNNYYNQNTEFYYGDNIRYKINYNNNNINSNLNNYYNNEILFIKSIFNMDEFISKFPKDNHMFYRAFCSTKLFLNFIREIIFSNDEQISLNHKFFDLITFFKKHKELRKQNKYKEIYLKYKTLFNKKTEKKEEKIEQKIFLNILNDINFNLDEKKILSDKNKQKEALINYSQLVNIINNSNQNQNPININNNIFNQQAILKYYIFPKMLFDNQFFDINYDKLFFRHYLEMPNHSEIKNLYYELTVLNKYYYDKYKEILIPKMQNDINNSTKTLIDLRASSNLNCYSNNSNNININMNTNPNLEVLVDNYVEYNWLLLVSCSLWYCFNPVETEIRINKIFDILEKIDFIEEQVLFFLYMAIYKFGNKAQFIKMFEFLNRFMGYSSYTNLVYLCYKLNQKEIEINNNMNDKLIFKKRSFINMNEINPNINSDNNEKVKEIKEKKNCENINSNNSNQKEEIAFYTVQKCPKCKKENQMNNIADRIHHRISKKRDNLYYKCSECELDNIEIKIKYQLTLVNKKKNESILISEGKFKLIPPHILYKEMKEKFIYLKDNKLDIDHIFSNNNINLLNHIFYFSDRLLPFDFLIPYEGQVDREYFEEDEEEDENNGITSDEDKEDKNNKINENYQIYSANKNFLIVNE